MSLQAALNQEAIDLLPKIKKLLNEAEPFEYNQMLHLTLQKCMNVFPTISEMNENQLDKFQDDLIKEFNYKELV